MSLGVMGDDDWKFFEEEMENSMSDEDRALRSLREAMNNKVKKDYEDQIKRLESELTEKRIAVGVQEGELQLLRDQLAEQKKGESLADIGEMVIASLKDESGYYSFKENGEQLANLVEDGLAWDPTYPEVSVCGLSSFVIKFWDHRKELIRIGEILNVTPAIDWDRLESWVSPEFWDKDTLLKFFTKDYPIDTYAYVNNDPNGYYTWNALDASFGVGRGFDNGYALPLPLVLRNKNLADEGVLQELWKHIGVKPYGGYGMYFLNNLGNFNPEAEKVLLDNVVSCRYDEMNPEIRAAMREMIFTAADLTSFDHSVLKQIFEYASDYALSYRVKVGQLTSEMLVMYVQRVPHRILEDHLVVIMRRAMELGDETYRAVCDCVAMREKEKSSS